MGTLADSVVAYAKPLLDQSDGSKEQLDRAFALAQTCWTLALLPDEQLEEELPRMRLALSMEKDE